MARVKLSGAERAKRFREKHKERIKEKNKERMRAKRAEDKIKRQTNANALLMYRKTETTRKRLYRQKKKKEASGTTTCLPSVKDLKKSFKSPQALGKAISKTVKALPHSPTKKQAVVSVLATKVGLKLQTLQKKSLDNDKLLQDQVTEFFYRPDIVYTAPGMKDEVTIWKDGKKVKLRKFYLVMFLKEAYLLFKDEFPNQELSFSSFCKLRPDNVFLLKQTPLDQCKCMTCENFFLLLKALKISYDSKMFWETVLCCEDINSNCWQGICEECSNGEKIHVEEDIANNIVWKQWLKDDGILTCCVKEASVGEVLDTLKKSLSSVAYHINVKRIQSQEFQKDKSCSNSRILQMDFAMNYSCSYQDEVQSALWSRQSITLFTAAVMHNKTCQTMLICSDTSEKEKNTVRAFIEAIYRELKPDSEDNKHLTEIIWTDGPSSEFKNRYMVYFLEELSNKYKKPFHWKYFATSHGKGVVDGIGGRAKSTVRSLISSKKDTAPVVRSADDFAQLIKIHMPSTKVMVILEKDICRNVIWDPAPQIPGISKMHIIKVATNSKEFFLNALTAVGKQSNLTAKKDVTVGNWVVVVYDGVFYPGEVVQIINEEIQVSVMERHGNHWKWPKKEDKLLYSPDNIIKIINPPNVVNSRGFFKFPDFP